MESSVDTAASSVSPVPSISPQQLASRIGKPGAPLLLDVRREARFAQSPFILAGAVRCAPEDVAALAAAGPAREVVVYCVYGHNVSEEAALVLNKAGWQASLLAGGIEGGEDGVDAPGNIALWRSQLEPLLRKRSDLGDAP